MAECYNTACPYCVDYQCRRTCTCDMRLYGEYAKVKHGRWIKCSDVYSDGDYECSECHKREWNDTDYCPNCGAKMDEGREDGTD